MEHVELYRDDKGFWRWRRKAANGEIIADGSEGYWNRTDCLDMAERINPGLPIEQHEEEQ
jgi:uncharacterized protein YegP (UPF0339 family)